MAFDRDPLLGRGAPGGAQSYYVAMEESKARAADRRRDRAKRGHRDVDPRIRTVASWVVAGIAIGLMAYSVWAGLGPLAGIAAAVALTVGAVLLWRLWR